MWKDGKKCLVIHFISFFLYRYLDLFISHLLTFLPFSDGFKKVHVDAIDIIPEPEVPPLF